MAELAEDNLDFAAAPQLEPAPDSAPVRAPSMAANASAFIIPQIAPEDCDPDPLADDTGPIDAFNDGGGKPGREESADKKSKRYFIELATLNNIGGNGGGPLNQETPEERQARLRAEIDQLFEEVKAQEARREREREERAREFNSQLHDFGGQKLSVNEISEIYDWFSKKENQEKIRAKLKAEGRSDQEVEETFRKIKEREELFKKLKKGTATKEEQERYKELGNDPLVIQTETKIKEQSKAEIKVEAKRTKAIESEAVVSDFDKVQAQIISQPVTKTADIIIPKVSEVQVQPADSGYAYFKTANLGNDFKVAVNTPAVSEVTPQVTPPAKPEIQVASAKIAAAINDM